MIPLYFGDSNKPLFGIYHQPMSPSIRDVAVLLCYPTGQEYMRAHWALRRLASLLSNAGFHVFRFDYFGTGDSAGGSWEGNVAHWKTDICAATDELKGMAGTKEVSVVGVRLGAALAAEASAEGLRVKDLVLWDPVVSGKRYIEELKTLHSSLFAAAQRKVKGDDLNELVGYPFPLNMRTGIERINLLELQHYAAERIFLIVSEERKEYSGLRKELTAAPMQFEYRLVADANQWGQSEDFDQTLLLNKILLGIRSLLVGNGR